MASHCRCAQLAARSCGLNSTIYFCAPQLEFPWMATSQQWRLWYHGSATSLSIPYFKLTTHKKLIAPNLTKIAPTSKENVSRAAKIMNQLEKIAVQGHLVASVGEIFKLSRAQTETVCSAAYKIFKERYGIRPEFDGNYATIANKLRLGVGN